MRNILLVVGATGLLGLFSACGGDEHSAVPADPSGGSKGIGGKNTGGKNTGGTSADDPGGASGAGGAEADSGPVVKITSPDEAATPDAGVLAEESVHVVCVAQKSDAVGAAPVNPISVTVVAKDATGKVIEKKTASPSTTDDEYEVDFVLTKIPSGQISFTCAAADTNKVTGTDTISAFVDHGPTITVVSPEPDSKHPVKGGLEVEFLVEPTPLVDDDNGAAVDAVVFALDGKELAVTEVSTGKFKTSLALDDTNKFPVVPSGAVTITASNKRTPKPTTATTSYNIVVDGEGPVIAITAPLPQAVVGGKIRLSFTVTDKGSGVDEKSVNVALFPADSPRFYNPDTGWSHDGSKYFFTFDSKDIEPDAPVQTTINVRASDLVGNPSASGQSLQLYFDNVPPEIDIDPRNVRMESAANCSGSFDPVGTAVVNDLAGQLGDPIVNPIAFFRVFVAERTNYQTGQQILYFSGTDQTQVRLYVQPDAEHATTKLLVNKNPGVDTTCDDIGGLEDLGDPPPFTALKPISATGPVGSPWNRLDGDVDPIASAGCKLTDNAAPPPFLCPAHNSDLWFVPFNKALNEPYVYVVGTPVQNTASCAGIDLAFVNSDQKDGWACAAARVVDRAGNIGISPPIRLCVDDGKGDPPACRISSTTPPTCSDGCTVPPRGGGLRLVSQ